MPLSHNALRRIPAGHRTTGSYWKITRSPTAMGLATVWKGSTVGGLVPGGNEVAAAGAGGGVTRNTRTGAAQSGRQTVRVRSSRDTQAVVWPSLVTAGQRHGQRPCRPGGGQAVTATTLRWVYSQLCQRRIPSTTPEARSRSMAGSPRSAPASMPRQVLPI
ncbi:hypothetical protein PSN01_01261 [Micromonospora saelicesensis]|nr:hypothetical protein PSN01_01261 [Micromonospora saelicesensis]